MDGESCLMTSSLFDLALKEVSRRANLILVEFA